MSENIVILMIGVSTFLGALGLIALLWGVKTGQFDDQSKFIDAARYDGEEELRDAVMMQKKQEEQKQKVKLKKEEEKQKEYMPPD
jgi:cbb3-type cytochrome oxidase maturation protein